MIKQTVRNGIIDDVLLQKTLPSGSTHGVLYGLPKVDKSGCPFHPIVSSVNTYNYNLVSYLVRVLQPTSTTSSQSRTLSVLLTGPRRTATTMSSCALLTLVRCSPTFHWMRP